MRGIQKGPLSCASFFELIPQFFEIDFVLFDLTDQCKDRIYILSILVKFITQIYSAVITNESVKDDKQGETEHKKCCEENGNVRRNAARTRKCLWRCGHCNTRRLRPVHNWRDGYNMQCADVQSPRDLNGCDGTCNQKYSLATFSPAPGNLAQRLENWNERRALALPYFLRSTTRGSRVRKPPRLSTPRRSGS